MRSKSNDTIKTLLGIGIGPSNLSLAALLSPLKEFSSVFFDSKKFFAWHPGMLMPNAKLQVSHLEDLVTLVDPTNPYSFVAFLANKKRLYRFIYAKFNRILRIEFNEYLAWVSQNLSNLNFSHHVEKISFQDNYFLLETATKKIKGKHLVLGTGTTPSVPTWARPYLGPTVFHSQHFLENFKNFSGKRVAVIGGGQSSAEIIDAIISKSENLPSQLYWISRRNQFQQLDESSFVYELFSPAYNEYFFNLNTEVQQKKLHENALANDGISVTTLTAIYQKLYALELIEKRGKFFQLLTNYDFIGLQADRCNETWRMTCEQRQLNKIWNAEVDIIIFCTGYERLVPACLTDFRDRIDLHHDQFTVHNDFSIAWDGPQTHRIYVQNGARHQHGVADTSLCLMAWRSAKIINSIAEKELYSIDDNSSAIDWNSMRVKEKYGSASVTIGR
ncbi:MAG: SidA/IucD/PvdA family monooxygenase [Gammaproteobacteria bacterium]|nr:SidA/IucD/PvdA family monooxygenase [Gammaproteobacteria bacterium]